MLPRNSRCIIGLEGEQPGELGESGAAAEGGSQAEQRVKKRFAAMWAGASDLIERFVDGPQQLQPVLPPPPRRNFDANTCIQLLNVLPENEAQLRQSALGRLRSFMAQDEAADAAEGDSDTTIPARRYRQAIPPAPSSRAQRVHLPVARQCASGSSDCSDSHSEASYASLF
jgi:hypothetical protein